MMNINIGTPLLAAINSKDAQKSLLEVQQFKDKMRDVTVGADYVVWITEPVNLTSVHKALAEDLNVPPKLLAIRRSALNRTQKAVMLVQAIEVSIKRTHSL
jgi:hypothetical protein